MAEASNEASGRAEAGRDTEAHYAKESLASLLRQLAEVVGAMSDEQYTRKGLAHVEGSAGGHVRHSLDHVDALMGSLSTGCVDYESRERGTDIETNRDAAVTKLQTLAERLAAIDLDDMAQPVRVIVRFMSDRPTIATGSSFGRELAFVLSHTIHHDALIAVIARDLGIELPTYFGYAPSSVAFLKQQ